MLARSPIPKSGYSVLETMRTLSASLPTTAAWTAVCASCAFGVELLHVVVG